jgi:uncharacterized membrane protein YgcG
MRKLLTSLLIAGSLTLVPTAALAATAPVEPPVAEATAAPEATPTTPAEPVDVVLDEIGFFTEAQEADITTAFAAVADQYGILPVVEVVQNLGGEAPEAFAIRRANELGVGTAEANNGLYVMFSLDERSLRVEPGVGVAQLIDPTEIQSALDSVMIPAFAANDHANGVISGVNVLASYSTTAPAEAAPYVAPNYGAIALGIGGFFGAVLAACGVGGYISYRSRKKKAAELDRLAELDVEVEAFKTKLLNSREISDKLLAARTQAERFAELDVHFRYTTFASDEEKREIYAGIETVFARENVSYFGVPAKFYRSTLQENESIGEYADRLKAEKPKAEAAEDEERQREKRRAEARKNWERLNDSKQEAYALADSSERKGMAAGLFDDYHEPDKAETYISLADVKRHELENAAKKAFNSLSSGERERIARASGSQREQYLQQYIPGFNPMFLGFYIAASSSHLSSIQAAEARASESSSSDNNFGSYSSSSTFSGGSFGGGGGGGSW